MAKAKKRNGVKAEVGKETPDQPLIRMTRWFRSYVGMATDPKFGGIARRAGRSRAEVLFVWQFILESAAEHDERSPGECRGAYCFDADAAADLMGIETVAAQAIHDQMVSTGLLRKGSVVSWERRQPKSDSSTERSRKHREKAKNADATSCNGNATSRDVAATALERELNLNLKLNSKTEREARDPPVPTDLGLGDGEERDVQIDELVIAPEVPSQARGTQDASRSAIEPHGALIPFPSPPAASRVPVRAAGPPSAGNDVEAAVEAYRRVGAELGWVLPSLIEGPRRSNVAARLKEHGLEGWLRALAKSKESAWLSGEVNGRDGKPFRMTLDWFANKTNFLKVIEGNYDGQASNGVGGITGHYIASRLERHDQGATARDHFK